MESADVSSLARAVLWGAFALAACFGALVRWSGFCTMGAVSDAVVLGDRTRLGQWAIATGVAVLGFAALSAAGIVGAAQTLYATPRWLWLSGLAGGTVFGFGMVLSSGCISKALVRVGGGNLKAVVVVVVAAVAGFATLKGITAVLRARTVDLVAVDMGRNADLASWLSAQAQLAPGAAALLAGVAVGLPLLAWAAWQGGVRSAPVAGAGAGIGLLVIAMWLLTGGVGHVAEHPETLQEAWLATNTGRAEAFSFAGPIAYALDWLLFFSDANKRLTVGIVSVPGVIAGSAAVALLRGEFRWEGFAGTADLGHHLAGALLMGIGGVTAFGCSIGQGVSGLATLSLTSFVAVPAMLAGAVLGVRYQTWRIDRDEARAAPTLRDQVA
ncbi:YeeE/YedE family protein [Ramlibacter algicola]|uniref:YeeE/YedE family protein n=1 Tax=Ramlibacter algicola TaxID=2795217 RepID=A0A934PXY5_9BURK|nr:YeeE/YedE family protein [Ramlibacter algicola]MBK0392539.1 YeeE/YedE family protein [Ramlibacter algicola]